MDVGGGGGGGEGITHRAVVVNGINMHVAEKGEGPVVLLVHGFPELWYTWRHQIHGLAARGFRAVAPDLRGFGDTDSPADVSSYSMFHLVGDLVALIDSLGQDQVFVVGHDWGAMVVWSLCMFRPEKVRAVVNLSVTFTPRNPARKSVEYLRSLYGEDYYVCGFQGHNITYLLAMSCESSGSKVLRNRWSLWRFVAGLSGDVNPQDKSIANVYASIGRVLYIVRLSIHNVSYIIIFHKSYFIF
ncbi:epoxide hydrolase 1-like isoform X2 [Elaeis guineensis]